MLASGHDTFVKGSRTDSSPVADAARYALHFAPAPEPVALELVNDGPFERAGTKLLEFLSARPRAG